MRLKHILPEAIATRMTMVLIVDEVMAGMSTNNGRITKKEDERIRRKKKDDG